MTGRDWTTTSAKWAAVLVLGGASVAGMAWSLSRPGPARVVPSPETSRKSSSPPAPKPQARDAAATETPKSAEGESGQHADAPKPGRVAAPAEAEPRASAGTPSHQINLNTATQAELELLPGIGPALAKRILEFRAEIGKFSSVDELDKVKGIGEKTLAKLRPLVTVE